MHELAFAEGIIGVITAEQKKHSFNKVLEIVLQVGEYSGIESQCLQEFFPYAAKGTAAEGAALVFKTALASFKCRSCGNTGPADRKNHCCSFCGSTSLEMLSGREFITESIKVE